jgi:hypothetical protein
MGFGMTAKILVGDDEADLRANGRFRALAQPAQKSAFSCLPPIHRTHLERQLWVEGGRTPSDLRSSQKGGFQTSTGRPETAGVRRKAELPGGRLLVEMALPKGDSAHPGKCSR